MMGRLATLLEEPTNEEESRAWKKWKWLKTHLIFQKKGDLKILLSVLACPLFPVPPHSKPEPLSSAAHYIIQHFTAATASRNLQGTVFATGTLHHLPNAHKGCFVLWQMLPDKWHIQLAVAGHQVVAGSDGSVSWRHTPWLPPHAAKGCVRPLRRALQAILFFRSPVTQALFTFNSIILVRPDPTSNLGLDPLAVSAVFSAAQYMGEKRICGVDCFVLKVSANQKDLVDRSDNTAEMIKHVAFGYFSQRNGLLVHLEDSYLTRIQSPGTHPTYWETTMSTKIEDYRMVDGVMIAHAGHSTVIITRFGDNLKTGPAITRLEESWTIDDVAFNVQGLSMDCFIPPKELNIDYPQQDHPCIHDHHPKP
ncbi:hypothetical protein VNO78_17982 [Psophocarpus tetragonolobus]|uniref:Lipase n=1 Tax=Psophocarpus tetragonolobus TaxID=3891 RepID=A0AAN9XLM7_PSOTE